jgi:hypothetical protein
MFQLNYRLVLRVLTLIVLGLLLAALTKSEPQPKPWEYFTIGLVFGTFFGQATLAAAWTALGPLQLVWRLPLALVWLMTLVAALAINMSLYSPGGGSVMVIIFGSVLVGQWVLAQVPMWGLSIGYGLRLRYAYEDNPATERIERQFGIRQLMLVTAVVATVLGIGRIVVSAFVRPDDMESGPWIIISFLAVAGIAMMLPLLLAALLPRFAFPASLLVLILIGLGTAIELPLLNIIQSGPGGGANAWHFYGINGVQAAWVLAFAGAVRLSGYGLTTPVRTHYQTIS